MTRLRQKTSLAAFHIRLNYSSLIYFYNFDKEGLEGGDFYILWLYILEGSSSFSRRCDGGVPRA